MLPSGAAHPAQEIGFKVLRFSSVFLLVATLALAACSSSAPEGGNGRRDAMIDKAFPEAADQQGLHMALPADNGMQIIYYQHEVSQTQVDRRMVEYCARKGYETTKFTRPPEPTEVKVSSGGKKTAISVWYDCEVATLSSTPSGEGRF